MLSRALTKLVLAVPLVMWAAPAHAGRDLVVWYSLTDSWVFTESANRAMKAEARALLPGHQIVEVKVNRVASLLNGRLVRWRLERAAQKMDLREGDRITHLVLSGHSGTDQVENSTHFNGFGSFDRNGPDEDLKMLIQPLLPFIAPDLVIVQNGCSTLCGSTEDVRARSLGLLTYLGAPHGQIYGSTVPESARIELPKLGPVLMAGMLAALYASGQTEAHAVFLPVTIGVGVGWAEFFGKVVSRLGGGTDSGRVLKFNNGQLIDVELIPKKWSSLSRLYHRTCDKILASP